MKFLPSKDQWIPGIVISVVTIVVFGMVMKKIKPAAAA